MPNFDDVEGTSQGRTSSGSAGEVWQTCSPCGDSRLDQILRPAWQAGVVLMGVSAGSICWHVGGTTDSFGLQLRPVTDALGFLPYSNSPHHDAERERRPLIHRLVAEGTLPRRMRPTTVPGLVYHGTDLYEAFTEQPGALAYEIRREHDGAVETPLPTRLL